MALVPQLTLSIAHSQTLDCTNVRIDLRSGVAYCADQPTSNAPVSQPATNSTPTSSNQDTGITLPSAVPTSNRERSLDAQNYEALASGMTLTAVVKQIGQPDRALNRQTVASGVQTAYQWQFQNGDVTLYFINDRLVAKISGLRHSEITPPSPNPLVVSDPNAVLTTSSPMPVVTSTTMATAFNRLESGMTLKAAQAIFGHPGQEQMRTQTAEGAPMVVYSWRTSQGTATAVFQADRLITKTWCGACRL
ncbi:MAG: hypothetical protein NZ772_01020 [Cyanobacteria bacterium]|nr:hypothetical protein [Cyanobacteriota bacterium]MDW8200816.1 hypothetical protein [Cyanobacteriota bacterium SKYGB_h_bin112]